MRVILTRVLLPLAVLISLAACAIPIETNSIVESDDLIVTNGVRFKNTNGEGIWGNGGNILQAEDGYFYWYGEKRDGSGNFAGISCHRSKDLVHWEERDDILSPEDSPELNPSLIERPKVIYNAKTKKYVLWFHKENAYWDYGLAKAGVAVGDTPDGRFEYKGSFRPFDEPEFDIHDTGPAEWGNPTYANKFGNYQNLPAGFMSRDCTLFVDTDGTAYFISSTMENLYLHIYRLTDDYLKIDTSFWPINPSVDDETLASPSVTNKIGKQREAPCLFKRGDYYILVTSGTDGWAATQTRYHYATDLAGPWTSVTIPSTTNGDLSQPTYVFTLKGSKTTSYLYMGDRWGPALGKALSESEMVWAPLVFTSDTAMSFSFSDALHIDAKTGEITYPQYYQLVNETTPSPAYLTADTSLRSGALAVATGTASTSFHYQWRLTDSRRGYLLTNRLSGMALVVENSDNRTLAAVSDLESATVGQWWDLVAQDNGYYGLQSVSSGLYLATNGSTLWQIPWGWRNPTWLASEAAYAAAKEVVVKSQRWKLVPVDSN